MKALITTITRRKREKGKKENSELKYISPFFTFGQMLWVPGLFLLLGLMAYFSVTGMALAALLSAVVFLFWIIAPLIFDDYF